jgi:hypothetical protein
MAENTNDKKQNEPKNPALKPDPETLNTTDPQEHMKGPVSSSVHGVEKEVHKGDQESKTEADKKKKENF